MTEPKENKCLMTCYCTELSFSRDCNLHSGNGDQCNFQVDKWCISNVARVNTLTAELEKLTGLKKEISK